MNQPQAPTAGSQRLHSLDVLRGFALLGILTMNVGSFAMPGAAYFDPTAYGDLSGLNGLAWQLTHLFADLKFMAIFSMLFGAGIVLFAQHAEAKGQAATGLHYRRMGWLVVFGLLHAHLLWYGDVLYWYGLVGMLVYGLRRLAPGWQLVLGLLLMAVGSGIMLLGGMGLDYLPAEELKQVVAELKPSPETKAAEIAAYQGSWWEQMALRTPMAVKMETETLLVWALWRIGGLMLLGMALFKLGVFSATRSPTLYKGFVAVALLVGLPLIGYGLYLNESSDWAAPEFFFFNLQFNYWASVLVSLGWVGLIMLLCQRQLTRLIQPLAAVGRMAFTNYILQSLLCTTLFYGHGLGWFGQVDRLGQAGIVVAVWVMQLVLSPIWLRHFRFGPLEWMWRSLVYRQRQPFRLAGSYTSVTPTT